MRLPRLILNAIAGMISVAAATMVAAQTSPACEKDVFVYIDVSDTMRKSRGPLTRLQLFAPAIDALLVETTDFLREGDRVRVVTFSGSAEEAFDETVSTDSLSRLNQVLQRIRDLRPDPSDPDSKMTNLGRPLDDLQEQLTDRNAYVIIASDLIHDPRDENAENQEERKKEFFERLAIFAQLTRRTGAGTEFLILDANVAGNPDQNVGFSVRDALTTQVAAEIIPVHSLQALVRDLKRRVGRPMQVSVGLTRTGDEVRFALNITNPNPFPVRLIHTKTGAADTHVDRMIGCGATETVELPAEPGARITAEFEVGEQYSDVLPNGIIDIDATEARFIRSAFSSGTLLLKADVRKLLNDDIEVELRIDGLAPQRIPVKKGATSERVAFSIPISNEAAARMGSADTVNARFTVKKDAKIKDGGHANSRPEETPTKRDLRNHVFYWFKFAAIFVALGILPTIRNMITKRALDASVSAGCFDYIRDTIGVTCSIGATLFLPFRPFSMSLPARIWWLSLVPLACIAAITAFYVVRIAAVLTWHALEPRGHGVLKAAIANRYVRLLMYLVYLCSVLAFIFSILLMRSLIADALVLTPL